MRVKKVSKVSTEEAQSSIAKYIQNEKDIAKYKISFLEKLKEPSTSQRRILNIEREFVSLPLESIRFQDLGDVAAAISIYRTSRSQFFEMYGIKKPEVPPSTGEVAISVVKKVKFLKKAAESFKTAKVQEMNFIQNSELYYDLIKKRIYKNNNSFDIEKKFLDSKDLNFLISIEPSVLAKKRARAQVSLYAIGEYISQNIPALVEHSTTEELLNIEKKLDALVYNIEEGFFQYYNDSAQALKDNLVGTMGFNRFLSKLHPIQNVLDFNSVANKISGLKPYSVATNFKEDTPMLGNLLFGLKKVIATTEEGDADRNIKNKVFGILIPIPHEGNEKMSLLYKKIYACNEDISHLFSNNFSNIKVMVDDKVIYSKAIMMHPFWKLKDIATQDKVCEKILSTLTGLDFDFSNNSFLNDSEQIVKINNKVSDFINISSNSRVLSPKTRSEDEGISEIFSIIKSKISELQEEYKLIGSNQWSCG